MTQPLDSAQLPPGPDTPLDFQTADDRLGLLADLFRQYGDIVRFRPPSARADTYLINDPAWVRQVLVTNHRNYTKGLGIDRVKILLGNGIMVSEGEQWKRQRRMIQPAFQRRVIEGFCDLFHDQARVLAAHWERQAAAGETLDITQATSDTTLQVILRAVFGADLETLGQDAFRLVTEVTERDLQFALKFRALRKLVGELVEHRRSLGVERFDYTSMLMAARDKETGEPMPENQLIDELMTLVVAGHETTAASLSWVWYLLGEHPEAAERMVDELASAGFEGTPSLEQLFSLKYTEQVIKEAMRLYPPGWLYTRRAVADDHFGACFVPAGTDIFICAYLLHRHPGHWDEPDAFRPERFEGEAEAQRERFVYIPFSAGPRHCVGETFAMAEMLMHLWVLAPRFRLTPAQAVPVELEPGVNLRARHPLMMKILLRVS